MIQFLKSIIFNSDPITEKVKYKNKFQLIYNAKFEDCDGLGSVSHDTFNFILSFLEQKDIQSLFSVSKSISCRFYNQFINHIYITVDNPMDMWDIPNVKNIIFPERWNEEIGSYCESLVYIYFGKYFNQSIDNLPISLKRLKLGTYFNQPIDNLPRSLTSLELGHLFDQPMNNLPNSLTFLKLGSFKINPKDTFLIRAISRI